MLRETGEHPMVLRENVTSPGGTTIAAIRELEDHRVRAAFLAAMEAARDRSPRARADGSALTPMACAAALVWDERLVGVRLRARPPAGAGPASS